MDHEGLFVKAFLRSEKQARWAQFLASAKRRREILDRLNRDLPYQAALATVVPSHQDFPVELERLLRAKGAGPTCHVMVAGLKLDGRELPLAEALQAICLQGSGAVLSCLPGRLAYYRPESPGAGILLERLPH